jgi:hypothetical protein
VVLDQPVVLGEPVAADQLAVLDQPVAADQAGAWAAGRHAGSARALLVSVKRGELDL